MGVSLVIRDGSPNWWESPDIWVVPGTDPNGSRGAPIAGEPAYLWANVANNGDVDVQQAQVDFWIADPSMEIRKSTANHIGTSFTDISAGGSQPVLCLVPWQVTLINGGHECAVVEVSTAADPLNPPPTDPDVLDAPAYPQIAQRNLSVEAIMGLMRRELILTVAAGLREDKNVNISVETDGELGLELLKSLGLPALRNGGKKLKASLSARSLCGAAKIDDCRSLEVAAARGTSRPVHLNIATLERLSHDEYGLVRVIERRGNKVLGGVSVVVVDGQKVEGSR